VPENGELVILSKRGMASLLGNRTLETLSTYFARGEDAQCESLLSIEQALSSLERKRKRSDQDDRQSKLNIVYLIFFCFLFVLFVFLFVFVFVLFLCFCVFVFFCFFVFVFCFCFCLVFCLFCQHLLIFNSYTYIRQSYEIDICGQHYFVVLVK
jgi:hypothetical protein